MFEEGNRLAKIYGAENVYDFSLGNHNVPAPDEVNEAIKNIVDEEESVVLHGYMSNSGFEDVREAIEKAGMTVLEVTHQGEWGSITARK